jgi:hypothetical protein
VLGRWGAAAHAQREGMADMTARHRSPLNNAQVPMADLHVPTGGSRRVVEVIPAPALSALRGPSRLQARQPPSLEHDAATRVKKE